MDCVTDYYHIDSTDYVPIAEDINVHRAVRIRLMLIWSSMLNERIFLKQSKSYKQILSYKVTAFPRHIGKPYGDTKLKRNGDTR